MTTASSSFLSAFDELGDALRGAGDSVVTLSLSLIDEDPNNPRRSFDDAELDALAATLKVRGLLQPVVVRPVDGDGRYRLRFGARRYRAALRAGLSEIPAIVRGGDLAPAEALLEQLIENEQREGLSTAELAAAVNQLLELDLTQAEIGRRLGRPKAQIAMLASVTTMPPELTALAPQLGLRTLYELHSAWKMDPRGAKVWLAGRDPSAITQAEARALAGRPEPARRLVRNPADGTVSAVVAEATASTAERERRKPAIQARGRSQPPRTAVFEVRVQGVVGTLVLDDVGEETGEVGVRLASGEIIRTPVARVRLVRVKPG